MLVPPPTLDHHTRTILALLLSLKKRPVIRWEKMSQGGRKLAGEVAAAMKEAPYRELFDFRGTGGAAPLLLILGELATRRSSLITRPTERPCHTVVVAVDVSGYGA